MPLLPMNALKIIYMGIFFLNTVKPVIRRHHWDK